MISSTFKVLWGHKNLLNFDGFLKVNLLAAVFVKCNYLKMPMTRCMMKMLKYTIWWNARPHPFYLVGETPKLRFGAFGELGELGPQISVFQLFKKWLSLLNVLLGSKKFTFLQKNEKMKKLLCFWTTFKGFFKIIEFPKTLFTGNSATQKLTRARILAC